MAEPPRAAFLPDRTVRVAAALLPASARDRYEREFLSELFGLSTWQQTRYALDILLHTANLRTAVRSAATTPELTMTEHPRRTLACRLNAHHHWVTYSTEDGGRFQRCRRCGKDRTEVGSNGPRDTSAGAAVIGLTGFGGQGGQGGM
jgi:hypothetical protein